MGDYYVFAVKQLDIDLIKELNNLRIPIPNNIINTVLSMAKDKDTYRNICFDMIDFFQNKVVKDASLSETCLKYNIKDMFNKLTQNNFPITNIVREQAKRKKWIK